jgi:hypothetical protein
MQINITYDQDPSTLPAGFTDAVNYAVQQFDTTFTNNITLNISVGYGELLQNGSQTPFNTGLARATKLLGPSTTAL